MCPPRGRPRFIIGVYGGPCPQYCQGQEGSPKTTHSWNKVTLGPAAVTGVETKEVSGKSESHSAKSVNKPGADLALRDTEGAGIALISLLRAQMSGQQSCPRKSVYQPGEGREVPGTSELGTGAWAWLELADGGRGRPKGPGVVICLQGRCYCCCFLANKSRTVSASGPPGALPLSSYSSLRACPSHSRVDGTW